MKVLSLFDGMSCGQIALNKVGIRYSKYYASEIKKSAITVTMANYPETIQVGDVNRLKGDQFKDIDLLIGGSPCQDFSSLKQGGRDGLKGEKSSLFYEYLRLLKEINPKYFLLENVKMKKESEQELNNYIGIKGVHINSELFSFQKRSRIYWTNIPFDKDIKDRHINFQEYKETCPEICRLYKLNKTPSRIKMWNDGKGRNNYTSCANVTDSEKIYCLTTKQDRTPNSGLVACDDFCRYLTRKELEMAQNVPVGYTNSVSYTQAQNLLGDGWTVDVIAHIFKGLL